VTALILFFYVCKLCSTNIILPDVLYGYETQFLTLREERRLEVLENRVMRRIIGPEREEVGRSCRTLHNDDVHNLYSAANIIRVIKLRSPCGDRGVKIVPP
jgi:hypothetical protein